MRRILAEAEESCAASGLELPRRWYLWLISFETVSCGFLILEARHYRAFGYHLGIAAWVCFSAILLIGFLLGRGRPAGKSLVVGLVAIYAAGLLVAVLGFPLNYLRSDMLPVILWADARVVHHLGPYDTMYVGGRVYDFPYLPGILVAYLPAVALGLDPRLVNLLCLTASAGLSYGMARRERRMEVAATLGLFLLCPFLQYRHDLYLEPHWLTIVLAIMLMRLNRHAWAALVWGASCGIYQLSWVLVPFVILYAWWRRGWKEAGKLALLVVLGAALITGPLLRGAASRVGHNTVGQWNGLHHALADPINLSYWLTFVVPPARLMYVQAFLLVALFGYCVQQRRCRDLADTLRWMSWALALFICFNVLVDGYFYLTLLVILLLYVLVASGWWRSSHSNPLRAQAGERDGDDRPAEVL